MATRIKLRRDTSANWTSNNPILALAEVGIVTNPVSDSVKLKIGDGVTTWNALAYFAPGGSQVFSSQLWITEDGRNVIVTIDSTNQFKITDI